MRKVRMDLGIDRIHMEGITGDGVVGAVLDSGISTHPDFGDRIIYFKDFINGRQSPYDDEGHGTHVTGIICGNGKLSRGMMKGIAPKTKIVALKVLNEKGMGKECDVIEGLHWIVDNGRDYGINVVNISFGTLGNDKEENKRLLDEVELLWDLGYVVVAAAGNNGPGPSSISTPGDCKKIITVGADNDNLKMIVNGKVTYHYSGRGPTKQCILKPDIVAPANGIFSCCNLWEKRYLYVAKSGTSMATPIVTGGACLMLEKNKNLSNAECKKIIKATADDMKMDRNRQGWGKINIMKALNT